jgi:hypothetical protein
MISALIAHICNHDPVSKVLFVAVDFILIVTCVRFVSKKETIASQQKSINS